MRKDEIEYKFILAAKLAVKIGKFTFDRYKELDNSKDSELKKNKAREFGLKCDEFYAVLRKIENKKNFLELNNLIIILDTANGIKELVEDEMVVDAYLRERSLEEIETIKELISDLAFEI